MLNRSQLEWMFKLAKTGRAYAGWAVPPEDVPEWARLEFKVQRDLIRMARRLERIEAARAAKKAAERASRETSISVLAKVRAKSANKDYRAAAIKAARTRKRQAAARAEAEKQTEAA